MSLEQQLQRVLSARVDGFEKLLRVERLSGGASQETYRIDCIAQKRECSLALRRAPQGAPATPAPNRPGLVTEAQLLRLAKAVGVPEPEVVYVLEPHDNLGTGFIMQWLDGETLGSRIVRLPELDHIRPKLAFQCGQILARIHHIDLGKTGLDKLLSTVSTEQFIRQTWSQYRGYKIAQPMIDYTARWLLDHIPESPANRLVHNDFRNGNLIVNQNGVQAVLDWEIAHIGDPMRDLGWICTNSWRYGQRDKPVGGFGLIADLLAGYKSVSGQQVSHKQLHFWQVFGSFWWAIGCLGMVHKWRNGQDPSVERLSIGRRASECMIDCVNLLIPGPVTLLSTSAASANNDMPSAGELLASVRDHLNQLRRQNLTQRDRFLSLVASNSVDIVIREQNLLAASQQIEHQRLRSIFDSNDILDTLRWRLTDGLRSGAVDLSDHAVIEYLRNTVANQVAIDQPGYSGLAEAIEGMHRQTSG